MEIIGKRFGRLTVLELAYRDNRSAKHFLCVCDCGNESIVRYGGLVSGNTKSCGCLRRENVHRPHGYSGTKTYRTWADMLQRCFNSRATGYENYGGRGITVCEQWLKFENFLADMGERPEGFSIDRIDNDGDYEPGNCRWADRSTQRRNQRKVVKK